MNAEEKWTKDEKLTWPTDIFGGKIPASKECPYDDGEGVCHADEVECPITNCGAKYDVHGNMLKQQLAKDEDPFIQRSVAINPHTPDNTLRQIDLLDATIVRIETFPSAMAGSKSAIALTIREIEEIKVINYF